MNADTFQEQLDTIIQQVAYGSAKIAIALERGAPPNAVMAKAHDDASRKAFKICVDAYLQARKDYEKK